MATKLLVIDFAALAERDDIIAVVEITEGSFPFASNEIVNIKTQGKWLITSIGTRQPGEVPARLTIGLKAAEKDKLSKGDVFLVC